MAAEKNTGATTRTTPRTMSLFLIFTLAPEKKRRVFLKKEKKGGEGGERTYHEEFDDKIRHAVRIELGREDAEDVADDLEDGANDDRDEIPRPVPE